MQKFLNDLYFICPTALLKYLSTQVAFFFCLIICTHYLVSVNREKPTSSHLCRPRIYFCCLLALPKTSGIFVE